MKPHSSFESKVLTAFGGAVLVVSALTVSLWKLAHDANQATQWVSHSHEVIKHLAHARTDALQIELHTQNFRLTGDTSHLERRDQVIGQRENTLAQLRTLTSDNPLQQQHMAQLQAVIDQRLAISHRIEAARKNQGAQAAAEVTRLAPLQATRDRMHGIISTMEEEENRLLQQRTTAQQRARKHLTQTGLFMALLLCGLLAGCYVLIRRQLQATHASRLALACSEDNLAITLHSIGDAVLATDTQGRITRMNPVAERLTGWPLAEAQGRPIDDVFCIIHAATRLSAEIPVNAVLATGQAKALAKHTNLLARDGRETPIADSAAPIRDVHGAVQGVVLVFRDVSAEQQAQRLLQQQNDQLEARVIERTAQWQESQDHLLSVLRNVPALIAYIDAQQRFVYANERYSECYVPGQGEIMGRSVREILGEERYAVVAPHITQALLGQAQHFDWQPLPGVWHDIHYAPRLNAQGQTVGYYVLGTDITERKVAESRIQVLHQDLQTHLSELEHVSRALRTLSAGNRTMVRATDEPALLDSMCAAIVHSGGYQSAIVWYCQDDAEQTLLPMAECGYAPGLEALRQIQTSWGDNEFGRGAVAKAIRSGLTHIVRDIQADANYVVWHKKANRFGSVIAGPLRVAGSIIGALAIYDTQADVFNTDEVTLLTELADDLAFGIATLRTRADQRESEAAMLRLTRFDHLTGLPNESQFTERLNAALAESPATHKPLALLQANIERLSEINDALGFDHGDAMLKEFGARLRHAAPDQALVARLRGDEFALLLPGADAHSAVETATRLQNALAPPFKLADLSIDISAQMGIALCPEHGLTPQDLYRHMDIAVQLAKDQGLPHAMFDPAQAPDRSRHLTLAGELRRAIEGGDLQLYLQPKVDMRSGQVCGAEGLVRWRHAERGLIPPGEFIGLAEHTGLIKPLTEWVMETAMRLNHDWAAAGQSQLPIAVNISARNLRDDKLLNKIGELQDRWVNAPGLFEMEITESTVMEDAEFALQVLHSLRAQGIPLYIDDFGTGYSSLSYLQKLPVDYIKIDQSFVRDMAYNKDSERIVRSTIDLIHDLGRKAVAEGVETQALWDHLAKLGCDMAQGYLIARPMPAEQFQDWLASYPVLATPQV